MSINTTLKTSVAAAALFAVAVPVAEAGNVTNGNGNTLSISGQVNKSVMYLDDGKGERLTVVDGDGSGTRFRMIGTGKINESLSVGTAIEMEYQRNADNNVSVVSATAGDGATGTGQTTFVHRKGELSFSHTQLGTLTVGHGYTVSWGTAGSDLSGVGLVIGAGPDEGTGIRLRTTAMTGSNSSAQTVGTFFASHDGLGRANRVSYATPTFAGLTLGADFLDDGTAGVGFYYGGKFGGVEVAAAGSYAGANGTNKNQYVLSGAIKHDSGISLGGHWGGADVVTAGRKDQESWRVRLGYETSLTAMGSTAFGIQYLQAEDIAANGDKGEQIEVGVVQNITDAGTELYAVANFFDVSRTGTTYEDVMTVNVGARVKF